MRLFDEFLLSKYGAKICSSLYNNGKLTPENIRSKNDVQQEIVKQQLGKLSVDLNLGLDIRNTNWAFDFPGWLGQLKSTIHTRKKYMIIGLEPHVERYDYQITYGLSDKTPSGTKRFEIDRNSKLEIRCNDDSGIIWTNIFKLIAKENEIREVLINESERVLSEFLNQFYITDLCHFAPQDKAKAVHGIKSWRKIRRTIAEEYLNEEIELLKPKVIITQGSEVYKEVKKLLKCKEIGKYPVEFSSGVNWNVIAAETTGNMKYRVISLPHIGSITTYRTFYSSKLEKVRDVLIKNKLLE